MLFRFLLLTVLTAVTLPAQPRVDPRNTYERLLCVAPMVGAGTAADPRRPAFAPLPGQASASREGILAFTYQVSDMTAASPWSSSWRATVPPSRASLKTPAPR